MEPREKLPDNCVLEEVQLKNLTELLQPSEAVSSDFLLFSSKAEHLRHELNFIEQSDRLQHRSRHQAAEFLENPRDIQLQLVQEREDKKPADQNINSYSTDNNITSSSECSDDYAPTKQRQTFISQCPSSSSNIPADFEETSIASSSHDDVVKLAKQHIAEPTDHNFNKLNVSDSPRIHANGDVKTRQSPILTQDFSTQNDNSDDYLTQNNALPHTPHYSYDSISNTDTSATVHVEGIVVEIPSFLVFDKQVDSQKITSAHPSFSPDSSVQGYTKVSRVTDLST